jgi:hypothetical protein
VHPENFDTRRRIPPSDSSVSAAQHQRAHVLGAARRGALGASAAWGAILRRAMASKRSKPRVASGPAVPGVPANVLARLRAICLGLPEAYEEQAWVGTRWMVRKRNFAHAVPIERGRPAAYARAARSDGPLLVLTFRTSDALRDVLREAGPRFFVAEWGTKWGTKVIGMKLEKDADWSEIALLLRESYRLLAPEKLAGALR